MAFHALPAKLAFVARLKGSPALTGVDVHMQVGEYISEENVVYVGTIGNGDRAGEGWENRERWDIQVQVQVVNISGDDDDGARDTEARLWELLNALDDLVKADPELDGAAWGAELLPPTQAAVFAQQNGWFGTAVTVLRIEVTA